MISRRDLLKSSAVAGAGLFAAGFVDGLRFALPAVATPDGYGPLQPDPAGLLDLPAGFHYDVVTQAGRPLAGPPGGVVPGRPDGTASLPGPSGRVYLVNNHEQSTGAPFPALAAANLTYDPGSGGGTTTLLVDGHNQLVSEYVSLAGTFIQDEGYVFAITGPFARLRRM